MNYEELKTELEETIKEYEGGIIRLSSFLFRMGKLEKLWERMCNEEYVNESLTKRG